MSSLKKKALPMLAGGAEQSAVSTERSPEHASGRPRFWRSFAELENRPEFRELLQRVKNLEASSFSEPQMEDFSPVIDAL